MEERWSQVSALVAAETGLCFPAGRNPDLERALNSAAREMGMADAGTYARALLYKDASHAYLRALVRHLTVGETYFWRDDRVFDALARHALAELVKSRATRREIKVWSAACCTGEEAYSLAILLQRCVPDWADWHITVLGTDINDAFLERALAGVYGEWSFRGVPSDFKEQYFTRTANGRYAILPHLKSMVRFASHNLINDASTLTNGGGVDVILCRNVLMYLTPEQVQRVIRNLHNVLAPQGWLVVGASEALNALLRQFTPVHFDGAVLYRKGRAPATHRTVSPRRVQDARSIPRHVTQTASAPSTKPAPVERGQAYATAVRLYEMQRYAEVVDVLTAEDLQLTGDADACSLLARALANSGRLEEALRWSRSWLAADSLDASAHYLQAILLQELGRPQDARRALRQTIYLDPSLALAHVALGNLARADGQQEQANKHFTHALDLLRSGGPDEPLRAADGLTARELQGIVMSLLATETAA